MLHVIIVLVLIANAVIAAVPCTVADYVAPGQYRTYFSWFKFVTNLLLLIGVELILIIVMAFAARELLIYLG